MPFGKPLKETELQNLSEAMRISAKERTCPNCGRKGALKIDDGSAYLPGLQFCKCRYCGYEATREPGNSDWTVTRNGRK